MTKGSDSMETVVSSVRPGMKREFASMMKAQSECGILDGQKRVSRARDGGLIDGIPESPESNVRVRSSEAKRRKKEKNLNVEADEVVGAQKITGSDREEGEKGVALSHGEEPKNDVLEGEGRLIDNSVIVNEEPKDGVVVESMEEVQLKEVREGGNGVETAVSGDKRTQPALEQKKKSKKVESKRVPTKLKELLETGLLEGLPVRYVRGSRAKGQSEAALKGTIKGSGVLCYCDNCNGKEVVTPNQFELHAGSACKRPSDYIYLENGNTLRDILNVCKGASVDSLAVAIQNAVGCSSAEKLTFCMTCKGPIPEAGSGRTKLSCDSCMALDAPQSSPVRMTDNTDRSSESVSDRKSCGRMASSNARTKSQGRVTKKDLRMHKYVFDELVDGTVLSYCSGGQKLLEGYKKGVAIFCYCCDTEVSPSQFEAHAGCASRRKPYLFIYTSNGVSLHDLAIDLSQKQESSAKKHDVLCSTCLQGKNLLYCDNCPRAFHPECASPPKISEGTWYCRFCQNMFQKVKRLEHNANAIAAGRVAGTDPFEQITKRSIRIVETCDLDVSACVLCRKRDFSTSEFGPRTVIICDQCDKEYHIGCLKEHNMDDLKELPKEKWFCCAECNGIHSGLEKLVADGEMKLPEVLLDIINKKHAAKGSDDNLDLDIRWRLFQGKLGDEEARKWLSGAVTLFHEQFDPIADGKSSRLDLIPRMVFGRKYRDQDLGGMYTAVLIVNSVVVSAGIFRIFDQQVAELPLVATKSDYQGLGYFQSLFYCIENTLGSLNVRDLVLPSAEEAKSIWINKFGFEKIPEEQLKVYQKDCQIMAFQGTTMLHKAVPKC